MVPLSHVNHPGSSIEACEGTPHHRRLSLRGWANEISARRLVQAGDGDKFTVRSMSKSRTSDSRNLRCPPGVRMDPIRPADAHRVTVFGSTLNSRATSPGVSNRSAFCTITRDSSSRKRSSPAAPPRCHDAATHRGPAPRSNNGPAQRTAEQGRLPHPDQTAPPTGAAGHLMRFA